MNNSSENNLGGHGTLPGVGRKRRADELDEQDRMGAIGVNVNKNNNATAEEIRNRTFYKVIRPSTDINTNPVQNLSQPGRFTLSQVQAGSTGQVDTSSRRESEKKEIPVAVTNSNASKRSSNPNVTIQRINISQTLNIPVEKKATEEKEKKEPEQEQLITSFISKKLKTSDNPFNPTTNTTQSVNVNQRQSIPQVKPPLSNPFLQSNPSNLNPFSSNPFTNVPFSNNSSIGHNPFLKAPLGCNPFAKAPSFVPQANQFSFGSFPSTNHFGKPTVNFNMTQAQENPNWKSDDEDKDDKDDKDPNNPEEEVEIECQNSSKLPEVVLPQSSNVKILKIQLNDLSVYNFEEKKYHSKGKGEFCIEMAKTEKENVVALCVFRNTAFVSIFQAVIVNKITTSEVTTKNYKFFGVIQKLIQKDDISGKTEAKSVKLSFASEKDSETFKEKFAESLKILEKNDLSIFCSSNSKEKKTTDATDVTELKENSKLKGTEEKSKKTVEKPNQSCSKKDN